MSGGPKITVAVETVAIVPESVPVPASEMSSANANGIRSRIKDVADEVTVVDADCDVELVGTVSGVVVSVVVVVVAVVGVVVVADVVVVAVADGAVTDDVDAVDVAETVGVVLAVSSVLEALIVASVGAAEVTVDVAGEDDVTTMEFVEEASSGRAAPSSGVVEDVDEVDCPMDVPVELGVSPICHTSVSPTFVICPDVAKLAGKNPPQKTCVSEAAYTAELSAAKEVLAAASVSGTPSALVGFCQLPKQLVG
jgi:hypothetical protein